MEKKIWLITGISSGLGKAMADEVMESGDFVIGTFRSQSQTDTFNVKHKSKAHALTLDITKMDDLENAIETIKTKFGKIDVLVNNAGYGFAGAIEETSDGEAKGIFDTNFFGPLNLTKLALPLFRKQKSGHIIQISSHGGFKAFPGFGIYNASKFALEGFSESLSYEVAPLGIKVTIVEPGPFRTNFAGNSLQQAQTIIDDYNETAGVFRQRIKSVDGKQEGDPARAAKAIMRIVELENPPLRLPLGKVAIISLTSKLDSVALDLKNYKDIAESCIYE